MAGLINVAAPSKTAQSVAVTSQAPAAKTATQTAWDVAGNQTVQGQLDSILSKDSKLNQLAASDAMGQANKRGLINTNLAVESAQNAMIRNALPVAQQDAQTFATAGQSNAVEANKIGTFNAGEANTTDRFNTGETNKVNTFNVGEANTNSRFDSSELNKVNMANAQNELALQRDANAVAAASAAAAEAAKRTSSENANSAISSANQKYQTVRASIQADPNMTTESKARAIAELDSNQVSYLNTFKTLAASGISNLLDFSGMANEITSNRAKVQADAAAEAQRKIDVANAEAKAAQAKAAQASKRVNIGRRSGD